MTDFDEEYFFIRWNAKSGRYPILTPDTNTSERRYAKYPPPEGSAPLIFKNGLRDEFRARGIRDVPADILFEGALFIVREDIRRRLLALDLPEVYLHPAIYIDDRDHWHEDYWFVGIKNEINCWDREKSSFDDEPIDLGDKLLYSIYTYALNGTIMANLALRDRVLFTMGGTADGLVTCHVSIAAIFRGVNNGAILQPILDY